MSLAAEHAATVTTVAVNTSDPWQSAGTRLGRVSAVCSCGMWRAEGVVNTAAPAYQPEALPTHLRTLHRDHVTDVLLDPAAAETTAETEWDAVLATLATGAA